MQLLDIQSIPVESTQQPLSIESTLQDLILYDCSIDINQPGRELKKLFEENLVLPGVILRKNGEFWGVLSRRRFLEILSRRYGPELFLRRAIHLLYEYAHTETLSLPANTKIVDATQLALDRLPELLYEPIAVQFEHKHEQLLDVHHLLLAHTHVHELTTKLLHEQTRSKLLQTEKMASLGAMVAGVSHEILNPVNFICGNLEYLSSYTADLMQVLQAYEDEFSGNSSTIEALKETLEFDFLVKDLPKMVESINIGSNRLRKIISALRSFSHMDEVMKRPMDIHECLDNTLLILNSRIKNSIEIVKQYEHLPRVDCFSGQLSQVFTNLLANAIDALTERLESNQAESSWKPQILIATKLLPASPRYARGSVEILLQDNGIGIPAQLQAKIFELFFTTKPVGKGTGFGLAIARQIVVEKHGGELSLQSELGVGTTFTIALPLG
ncbi:MAG: ATP-binding protein [Leptolyngbyaceae cyanobacterium bins.302]|nr:ATP-binding protein [Leptolyngbyaceae cyanobacterium bins.302]